MGFFVLSVSTITATSPESVNFTALPEYSKHDKVSERGM